MVTFSNKVMDYEEIDEEEERDKTIRRGSMVQEPDRHFHCSDCGLWFRRLEHLQRHALVHSGEKPFVCTVCDRGFNRFDALQRHSKIHRNHPRPKRPRRKPVRKPRTKHIFHYYDTSTKTPEDLTNAAAKSAEPESAPVVPDNFTRLAQEATLKIIQDTKAGKAYLACPIKGCDERVESRHATTHMNLDKRSEDPEHTSLVHTAVCRRDIEKDLLALEEHVVSHGKHVIGLDVLAECCAAVLDADKEPCAGCMKVFRNRVEDLVD
ncbi:uncharacterized protein SPPG_08241 [Spizellomyces punctatus DAOM BR117]|uniref:C2H2-type domain-containing protein n=1 Tax=Spizellomyces punctatus (strain DAOM BR117) TaxID=645134 RepID=A0A0L0H5T7_SPIPD|nr:uncharacterized protein SPPG_08241 [Spizellomyces punctatus DAOM BR117]KNC96339.1 hypothetical protein SPPG_08241 [Spizellomyces punctatus DAOM BR117]|eukprot:XP_016604379.1 hypothetical protein SPPG_08241 [Spizellomyces punctatus DAOM BR117]